MPSNVWDEITYPIPNFNNEAVEVYNVCNYLSMLGLKLNDVSKWGPVGVIPALYVRQWYIKPGHNGTLL